MQTRWLSVIKPGDSALIKSPLYETMGVCTYDLMHTACVQKKNKKIKSESLNGEQLCERTHVWNIKILFIILI